MEFQVTKNRDGSFHVVHPETRENWRAANETEVLESIELYNSAAAEKEEERVQAENEHEDVEAPTGFGTL